MRRKYITPEIMSKPIYGTYNDLDVSNFFNTQLLNIPNDIYIDNDNIYYYQNEHNEQIDFNLEMTFEPIIYSSIIDKGNNNDIYLDPTQTQSQKTTYTKWIIDIDYKSILFNYIKSMIKNKRLFASVSNYMVIENNIDTYINNYINKNIIPKYKITRVDLYTDYSLLLEDNNLRYNNLYYYNNNKTNKSKNIISDKLAIYYTQERLSSEYYFKYYFNILFSKI